MSLTVPLAEGRTSCTESIEAFLRAVDGLDEYELLGWSRCHGWTRLDVVVHVLTGWQEMLGGLVSTTDGEPTVDAASYWPAFTAEYGSGDPVPTLMAQRRRTATYLRPSAAAAQLDEVGAALLRGVGACPDRSLLWQGHVFTAGDFLAVWAVENVVHLLDLRCAQTAPPGALGLVRATVEALVEEPLPAGWSDRDAALIGTGRVPVPEGTGTVAARLPALG